MLLTVVQCYSLSLSDPSSCPHRGPLQTASARQSPAAPRQRAWEPPSGQPCHPGPPVPALRLCPRVVRAVLALGVCVAAQCLAHSANTRSWISEELWDLGWGCTHSAPRWCSKRRQGAKPAAEGECCQPPGRNADGFGVKVVAGFLRRGMSWTTSGPIQWVFPQRGMGRIVSCKGWLVSVIFARQILFAPSFSSCSRSLSA